MTESPLVAVPALALIRGLAWAYALQPAWLRRAWGSALGGLLRATGMRSKIVEQNLALAYPASERERARLLKAAYRHLGDLSLEILMLFGPMRRYVRRSSRLEGAEHWRAAHARGKGVIFLASHVGNWEIMAATGAAYTEMDLMLVTKHLKPEWLHRAIERGRASCRVRATYEPRTLKDVLGHLKRGGTVGFVLDQYAGPPVGVRVPVFGVPVGTTTAVATLARRTGAVVLPVVNYRVPGGRAVVEIRPPLEWKPGEDPVRELAENTALYAERIERDIRAHPEQWLWIHRRFKGDLTPLRDGEWNEHRARQ
jgi:KDO2-lipid IV(A) lauroyltransferase